MRVTFLTAITPLLVACAGGGGAGGVDVVEERVTYDHGMVTECGEGAGLNPCLDARGRTTAEELDPNYVDDQTNDEMLKSSAEIKNESPEELERTIKALEES